jgi:hypothetical protein
MIHKTFSTQRNIERDMNLALDDALPETAEAALKAHLAGSPRDAALFNRMRDVDNLFANASMVQAPPDFAAKVMAAIAAQTAEDGALATRPQTGTGAALGLLLAFLTTVPLAVLGINAIQNWLSDPAAINTLLRQLVMMLNNLAQAIAALFQVIATYTVEKPVLPALLTTTIPLTMIWGWFMWYTSMRRQQVVYHIPVRIA